MQAINQKNVMQQQALTAQNELQKNTFQAQGDSIKAAGRAKAITAEAEAQARANQLLAQSITPTLVQYEQMKKWNGQLPQVSGGAVPMIQLPRGAPVAARPGSSPAAAERPWNARSPTPKGPSGAACKPSRG
jgi:regulator of protease activity HflC (stomatin/prohibitin superfamily)